MCLYAAACQAYGQRAIQRLTVCPKFKQLKERCKMIKMMLMTTHCFSLHIVARERPRDAVRKEVAMTLALVASVACVSRRAFRADRRTPKPRGRGPTVSRATPGDASNSRTNPDDDGAGEEKQIDETDASASRSTGASEDAGEALPAAEYEILLARMRAIRQREASLDVIPIVVLDATVPKQRLPLTFDGNNPRRNLNAGTWLGTNVELGQKFGMLGQAPSNGQILPNGVLCEVTRLMMKPSGDTLIELTAGRRFKIYGQPFEDESNDMAPSARVIWIDDDSGAGQQMVLAGDVDTSAALDARDFTPEALAMALALPEKVQEWLALVVSRGRERQPNQLKLIQSHIGPMPDPRTQPAELACWVAALINPIPALGVAFEIRPALLLAPTVSDMIGIAMKGLALSCEKLRQGPL